jgi:hypothetical protein
MIGLRRALFDQELRPVSCNTILPCHWLLQKVVKGFTSLAELEKKTGATDSASVLIHMEEHAFERTSRKLFLPGRRPVAARHS